MSESDKAPQAPQAKDALRTQAWTLTDILALLFLLAVFGGIGVYVYGGSAEGFGYLFGLAIVPAVIVGLLVWKEKVRISVAAVIIAAALIWFTRDKLIETYDVRNFQSEVQSASTPDEYLKALENSNTSFAKFTREGLMSAKEAKAKVEAIFAELDDPSLLAALEPANIANADLLHRALGKAKEKAALSRSAMQRIDAVLSEEVRQYQALAAKYSRSSVDDAVAGVKERHVAYRQIYERQATLLTEWLDEVAEVLTFLASRSGSFRVGHDKTISFDDAADADQYNSHVTKLTELGEQQNRLDADIKKYQEYAAGQLLSAGK